MDHVGVVVEDVAAAVRSFVELGFELEGETPADERRADRILGRDGARVDVAVLRTPDGRGRLELMGLRAPTAVGSDALYGRQLARIHHAYFSDLARAAAAHLLRLLEGTHRNERAGTVVELACGSGVSSKLLTDAGCEVLGVEASEPMLELARAHAPNATFVRDSLWEYELPTAVDAVTAIGEAFCYHGARDAPTHEDLGARLRGIFASLCSGGVLLFDVATPGRSGATGRRQAAWKKDGSFVYLDETEDVSRCSLERVIDTFAPAGELHRHERERHRLTLYDTRRVAEILGQIGFRCRQTTVVGGFALPPGWVAFEAVKP